MTEQRHEIYDLKTELEEEKGKNLKLRGQNDRDYENSSIPSSKSIKNRKTAKTIVKQIIGIHVTLDVSEYHADVYYNSKTGECAHAVFSRRRYE